MPAMKNIARHPIDQHCKGGIIPIIKEMLMATYPTPGPFIKKILLRTALYELIVFLIIGGIGIWGKWFTSPIQYEWFGNFFFIAGILILILAGFTVASVRQMPQGQGAFIAMQTIGTVSDGNPEARARLWGFTGFLKANVTTISLALAGILSILLGVLFQTLA